jgi:ent-kaurene oxidase
MQSLLAGIPAGGAAAAAAVGGLVAAAALAERADQKNRLNLPPGDLTCIGDPRSSLA